MSIKFTSVPPKVLYQSITSAAMYFKLNNIKGWDGNNLTSSDFGTQAFGVFLSSDRTKLELFQWDPSTVADSQITIVKRGMMFDGTQGTEVTANKLDWTANETTVLIGSDVPQYLDLLLTDDVIDTDATLAANSDAKVTSQKAVKTYIANVITSIIGTATNLLFGTVKLSTAAASPSEPIAVGDNDTRVPTQGENDALVGTSGTPSTTNKYVTNDDTSNAGTADKVVRLSGTNYPVGNGSAITNLTPGPKTVSSFTAGESITAGDALSLGLYQSAAGAAIDNYNLYELTGTGSYSQAFSVASNDNRILVVGIFARANSTAITNVQFDGVTLTQIGAWNNDPQSGYVGYLVAPATGSKNVTFSAGTDTYNVTVWSLYNAAQGAPDASNVVHNSTSAASATPTVYGCIGIGMLSNISSVSITPGGNFNKAHITQVSNWAYVADTSVITPITAITASGQTAQSSAAVVIIAPYTAASLGVVKSSSNAGTFSNYLATDFIGFAQNSAAAGASVNVITGGIANTLTGLVPFAQYYLSTSGGIATSAGSVTKKAGIAVSATELLITNI